MNDVDHRTLVDDRRGLGAGLLGRRHRVWIAALAAGPTVFTLGTTVAWYVAIPAWLLSAAAVLLLGVPRIRRRHVTAPLFRQFRKVMPPMSQTEQEALEAGVWWDAELFTGKPDWQRLLNLPKPHLSQQERAFLDQQTDTLCRMLDDWRITHEDRDLSLPGGAGFLRSDHPAGIRWQGVFGTGPL